MKADILIVEDDQEYADLAALYLEGEGVSVRRAESCEAALDELRRSVPELVLLDINLPAMDGFDALSELRRISDVPVIIVSAREEDEDILTGLSAGADEFVSKPVAPRVLAARVRAMLRRSRATSARQPEREREPEPGSGASSAAGTEAGRAREVFRFGPFTLEPDAFLLERDGERVPLSGKEFDVLAYLVRHAGSAQSPETIYREVWQQEYGDITSVAVYIQRLRKKLGEGAGHPRYLHTVFGRGYLFRGDGSFAAEDSE